MSRKPRLTPFARFFLFLIVIVPTALVVSHMANNDWTFNKNILFEDLGLKQKTEITTDDTSTEETTTINSDTKTNTDNPDFENGNFVEVMEKRIGNLENKLIDAQEEIADLKRKLEAQKELMNASEYSKSPIEE